MDSPPSRVPVRSFSSQGGFEIPTPGSTSSSYRDTLRTILHELGHQVQSRQVGDPRFLSRHYDEVEKYEGQDRYNIPGTLEYEAEDFMEKLFSNAGRLGL